MIVGTVRTEEARVFDSHAGYHRFHADESQEPYGSFEVFWYDGDETDSDSSSTISRLNECTEHPAGWYWAAGFPGYLYDGDPMGPFASSQQAHRDADEWAPEYDESFAV